MNLGYYERRLPHWHPDGAALFVTWRLHGSLPKHPPAILNPGRAFVAMDQMLAQAESGPKWLQDSRVAAALVHTLEHGEQELKMYGLRSWVIMPNHVHILIDPMVGLSRITKAIKGFSARRANEILGRAGQPFWQDESYDHWVRNPRETQKIVRYIEGNPVAAGLAEKPEDWKWSSGWAGREACPTLDSQR